MSNLGFGEILVLAVIALIVLGPERLPTYAADAARLLRKLRRMAKDASSELREELGTDLPDISLTDLANPRRMVARYLFEDDDQPAATDAVRAAGAPLEPGEVPPYDAEAT